MSFNDFMNKVRYWDNRIARALMRHFYFMFFQFVLLIIFLFWFANTFKVIDVNDHLSSDIVYDKVLQTHSVNLTLIVLILLLNSFWTLYMFNGMQRILNSLKDISFHISKLRIRNQPPR